VFPERTQGLTQQNAQLSLYEMGQRADFLQVGRGPAIPIPKPPEGMPNLKDTQDLKEWLETPANKKAFDKWIADSKTARDALIKLNPKLEQSTTDGVTTTKIIYPDRPVLQLFGTKKD
jgi:hypothetical protein